MKNLFIFCAALLFALQGIAQQTRQLQSTYLKVTADLETTTYAFHALPDLETHSEKILEEFVAAFKSDKKGKSKNITVEISITTSSSAEQSTTVTGSVTAFPETIIPEVSKLRNQLIAIING